MILAYLSVMPSLPRHCIVEDGSTFHVTWQCHNQDWLLQKPWVKQLYYNLLLKYKDRYAVSIYSYCFMDNHLHLSGKLSNLNLFSDFFRVVNSSFARLLNKELKRRGQVVMDRFKSPQIQTDADLLKVMLYIDLNPKRANIVAHPQHNQFSSYAYYAQGIDDPLITPSPSYLGLGLNPEQRQLAYRALVEEILKDDWKEKKPYSSVYFIGDPDWVIMKNKALKEQSSLLWNRWKERYRQKFGIFEA